jgi:hypothetical protein
MGKPVRTDEFGWRLKTIREREQVGYGSVQRRSRGVYLARCADDAGNFDECDAFSTLAAAKRWVKESGDETWTWGRWERDPAADAWYCQSTSVIEREVEA